MIEGRVWTYSTEFLAKERNLTRQCLTVLSASETSEKDLESAIWDAIAFSGTRAEQEAKFFDAIEATIRAAKLSVGPNFLVRLLPPLKSLTIGKVKIIPFGAANTGPLKGIFEVRQGARAGIHSEEGVSFIELPNFVWEVSINSSTEYVREEAQWAINIAISLIRLGLISYGNPTGLFPNLGKLEAHPIEPRTIHQSGYILSGTNVSVGGTALPGWYEVGQAAAEHFTSINLSTIADIVFDPQSNSVAERLYNGLGWMTLARQAPSRAERFIHYFTAVEALLTSSDPTAPITQTISRFLSCILTDNNDQRAILSDTIKKLYTKRSQLVHGGRRSNIHMTDATTLQYYVELAYLRVVKEIPPATTATDFLEGLNLASYGLNWTKKTEK